MEATNKNARLILTTEIDGFIFDDPKTCLWDNYQIGTKTTNEGSHKEWSVTIGNPVGQDIILHCKQGDFIAIQTFVDFDGNIVAKTAITLPWKVACNYIYGYDELIEQNVSLESCFVEEVDNDMEPSMEEIRNIEDFELNDLLEKSKHLTIEDLLEDDEIN